MKPWQIRFEERLRADGAPAVLSRDLLARMARSARVGTSVPVSSLTHWIKAASRSGKLQPVLRGLYLNRWRLRPGVLADAAPWLRADAVVSLNTALADAGVLNNPTRIVTAVVPLDPGAPPPRLGRQLTRAGSFQFHGLPRRILEAGAVEDRLGTRGQVRASSRDARESAGGLAVSGGEPAQHPRPAAAGGHRPGAPQEGASQEARPGHRDHGCAG